VVVVVVVLVVVVVAVVAVIVVVAVVVLVVEADVEVVVDLEQDAKTRDVTMRQLSATQIIPLFILISFFYRILPEN